MNSYVRLFIYAAILALMNTLFTGYWDGGFILSKFIINIPLMGICLWFFKASFPCSSQFNMKKTLVNMGPFALVAIFLLAGYQFYLHRQVNIGYVTMSIAFVFLVIIFADIYRVN